MQKPTQQTNTHVTHGDDAAALCAYLTDIRRAAPLSKDEELRLGRAVFEAEREARRGAGASASVLAAGAKAKRMLVESSLHLVVAIARRYRHSPLPLIDRIQEGNIGLMRAAEKYDYHRGHRFSTYAAFWIRQAITRALHDKGRLIRLPVNVAERLATVLRVARELTVQLDREPTNAEVAHAAGIAERDVAYVVQASREMVSLGVPVGERAESSLADRLVDDGAGPEQAAERAERARRVAAALATLRDREREILALRYGFGGRGPRSRQEVAHKLGISRERVRQIEHLALERLREQHAYLADYLPAA
jgi:RNA polymerase primary sigma factor